MKKRCFYLILAFLIPLVQLCGQSADWHLRIYGFDEGLSHRNVFDVQQDSNGYLWIATVNGLNRYDGYNFIPFNNASKPGLLAQDVVSDLYCDSNNQLWLGHPNYLTVLNTEQLSSTTLTVNKQSLARGAEWTPSYIEVGPEGNVWLTTFAEQDGIAFLQCFSPEGELLLERKLAGKFEKHPMLIHAEEVYVAGDQNEIWRIGTNGILEEKYTFSFQGKDPAASRIVEMQEDSQHRLLVLLANGQIYFKNPDEAGFRVHPISASLAGTDVFNTFRYTENGDLWLAAENGLILFEENSGTWWDFHRDIRELVRQDIQYRHIFSDASGVVWVASDFGLIKLVRRRQFFYPHLNGGNSYCSSGFCSMRGIAEDPSGNIFFSYYNAIHKLDPNTGESRALFPDNAFVNAPFGLAWYEGDLYTGNGLRINLDKMSVDTLFKGRGSDSGFPVAGPDGNLWICFQNHLYTVSKAGILKPYRDAQGVLDTFKVNFTHLHFGQRSGFLWLATQEAGLYKLDLKTGQLSRFKDAGNGLKANRILATYEDAQGHLWIATANGLHELDLVSESIKVWNTEKGLPNNFINGILPEGDSCMWVSTDNGLARLSIEAGRFFNFFQEDGLPANEFNRISFHLAASGRMYFGGLNGIVSFFPDPDFVWARDRRQAKLLLTSFSKFDGDIDSMISIPVRSNSGIPIQLSWRDKFFTFSFALADYVNPRENRYSYRLRGFETEWSSPTTVPTARYNNIPSGDYIFEVRASSGNNSWSPQVLEVPLKIEQAYYKSLWFIALCALVLLAIAFGFFRYRIYTIRKRERYLEEQVTLRTTELEEEKQKSDDLLLNILPAETADELKATGTAKAQRFDSVTVMFSDFIGFTAIAEKLEPEELVKEIDYCFRAFDEIMEIYGIEKIKTIGDAYMCVGGLPGSSSEAAAQVVKAALEMQAFMAAIAMERELAGRPHFEARIGIHTGPVVAGIVGIKKFAYDIWGDTVNIASRLESRGASGKVNISKSTYALIKDVFNCTPRGKIKAKNKGDIEMFFVDSIKEESTIA
ncbi:MAG: hypothetical protein KDC34_11720 [Saprospiraceae bacterium]|nr:hypothetical protein [Saprospiraceae bacterium]